MMSIYSWMWVIHCNTNSLQDGHALKENRLSFQQLSVPSSSQVGVGLPQLSHSPLHPYSMMNQPGVCPDLERAVPMTVCSDCPMHLESFLVHSFWLLPSFYPFTPIVPTQFNPSCFPHTIAFYPPFLSPHSIAFSCPFLLPPKPLHSIISPTVQAFPL